MILNQHYLACLSQASYLLGDESTGTAIVVDPRRDVDVYVEEAARLGLVIRHVVLTHFHADFAAGHLELRARTGCSVHLGAQARADFPFSPLSDGDVLEAGDLRVRALETPGHTPESICLLVYDLAKDAEIPQAVLTGDTLFIGDVGRPDLMASEGASAEELARLLYRSLRTRILPLPDSVVVYPGHGAGSLCGKALSAETSATLGSQRASNYALQPIGEEHFVELVTRDQSTPPSYFGYDAAFNRASHATLDEHLAEACRALDPGEVRRELASGALLLDVRSPADFARGFVRGAWNVGLDGRFATWAGAVLDPAQPIVVLAPAGREREALLRLGRIGFDNVAGYVAGGTGALPSLDLPLERIERVDAAELARRLGSARPPAVLDVREPGERAASAIEGSAFLPLGQLRARLAEAPAARPLVVHCAGGYRSMVAASILAAASGSAGLADLAGGMSSWLALDPPARSRT